jgi:hypothetical protein
MRPAVLLRPHRLRCSTLTPKWVLSNRSVRRILPGLSAGSGETRIRTEEARPFGVETLMRCSRSKVRPRLWFPNLRVRFRRAVLSWPGKFISSSGPQRPLRWPFISRRWRGTPAAAEGLCVLS